MAARSDSPGSTSLLCCVSASLDWCGGRYGDCANGRALSLIGAALRGADSREGPALAKVEDLMQRKAEALALARRQMHITAMLEAWLFVHVPATFALLAALTAHIVSVFLYW